MSFQNLASVGKEGSVTQSESTRGLLPRGGQGGPLGGVERIASAAALGGVDVLEELR